MAKSACHVRFEDVLGKSISEERLAVLRGQVNKERSQMFVKDPAGAAAMSDFEIEAKALSEVAKWNAADLLAKQKQAVENAAKQAEILNYAEAMHSEIGISRTDSIRRTAFQRYDLGATAKGRGAQSAETLYLTVKQQSWAKVLESLDAAGGYATKFFGALANNEQMHRLLMEDRGVNSKDAAAKKIMEVVHKVFDENLQRYKDLGGRKAAMEDYSLQSHDRLTVKIGIKGAFENDTIGARKSWSAYVKSRLDHTKYKNPDGSSYTEKQYDDFLVEAWRSITEIKDPNDAAPKLHSELTGVANKMDKHRELHFTPEGYLEYHSQYGGGSVMEMIDRHLSYQAKEIAILKNFGPAGFMNFEAALRQAAYKDKDQGFKKIDGQVQHILAMAKDFQYGEHIPVDNQPGFLRWKTARNLMYSGLMGSSAIPAFIMDNLNVQIGNTLNGTSAVKYAIEYGKQMGFGSNESRAMAQHAGIGIEVVLNELGRMGEEAVTNSGRTISAKAEAASSKAATAVMMLSLNNRHTKAARTAHAVMLNSVWSDVLTKSKDFNAFNKNQDSVAITGKGINEQDFKILKQVADQKLGPLDIEDLSKVPDADISAIIGSNDPAKIREARRQASDRYFGAMIEQANMGVYQPTFSDSFDVRNFMNNKLVASWGPTLGRSVGMFWTFMMGVNRSHIQHIASMKYMGGKGAQWAYGAKYVAAALAGGAVLSVLDDLRNGRDPRELYDPEKPISSGSKTAGLALARGGAGGIFGAIFLGETDPQRALGPVVTTAYDLGKRGFSIGSQVIQQATGEADKDFEYGKETVGILKSVEKMVPGNNLWWSASAFNRYVKWELYSYLDPDFYDKLNKSAEKYYGSEYYFDPETKELRMPKFENIIKE